MGDFTALPVDTGVGNYHFNRFRIVFKKPQNLTAQSLAQRFTLNFPLYFNSEFASVEEVSNRFFDGFEVLRFHGKVMLLHANLARPHSDWVALIGYHPSRGFLAQTLKREFLDLEEDVEAVGGGAALGAAAGAVRGGALVGAGAGGILGGTIGGHYNRMHFLAGRRSWVVADASEFGISGEGLVVLETAAVERFSAVPYELMGDALESKVPLIWGALLRNFAIKNNLEVMWFSLFENYMPPWSYNRGVYSYFNNDLADAGALKADKEFGLAAKIHAGLLP
jgi:hypothetical protein